MWLFDFSMHWSWRTYLFASPSKRQLTPLQWPTRSTYYVLWKHCYYFFVAFAFFLAFTLHKIKFVSLASYFSFPFIRCHSFSSPIICHFQWCLWWLICTFIVLVISFVIQVISSHWTQSIGLVGLCFSHSRMQKVLFLLYFLFTSVLTT